MFHVTACPFYPGHFYQCAPLARCQRYYHHAPAVAGFEIVAECPVKIVAVLRLIASAELSLRDASEIADHRERNVRERQINQLPLSGQPPMTFRREQADCRERAQSHVPP